MGDGANAGDCAESEMEDAAAEDRRSDVSVDVIDPDRDFDNGTFKILLLPLSVGNDAGVKYAPGDGVSCGEAGWDMYDGVMCELCEAYGFVMGSEACRPMRGRGLCGPNGIFRLTIPAILSDQIRNRPKAGLDAFDVGDEDADEPRSYPSSREVYAAVSDPRSGQIFQLALAFAGEYGLSPETDGFRPRRCEGISHRRRRRSQLKTQIPNTNATKPYAHTACIPKSAKRCST